MKAQANTNQEQKFCMYVKGPENKTFKPVNLTQGKTVIRLIHATVIQEQFLHIAKNYIEDMKKESPALKFELREWGKKKVIYSK